MLAAAPANLERGPNVWLSRSDGKGFKVRQRASEEGSQVGSSFDAIVTCLSPKSLSVFHLLLNYQPSRHA